MPADDMSYDPSRAFGRARLGTRLNNRQRTPPAPKEEPTSEQKAVTEEERAGSGSRVEDLYQNVVADVSERHDAPVQESIPTPKPRERSREARERAADAEAEAHEQAANEVEARIERASKSVKKPSNLKNSISVSSDLVRAAKAEFPEAKSNARAVEALIAYHIGRADLAPEEDGLREVVAKRIVSGEDATATASAMRALSSAVSNLSTMVSASLAGSVAQLAHWYEDNYGRSGVPLEEWLGTSDTGYDVMAALMSVSSQYREASRRSGGRKPSGFGRGA